VRLPHLTGLQLIFDCYSNKCPCHGEARRGQAAAKVYGRALLDTELAAIAERYGAYRGYWAHYLRVGHEAMTRIPDRSMVKT